MKYFLIAVSALVVFACNPIVDRDELRNIRTVDEVELVATQSTQGGNLITLHMTTPGITGYWDYNLGKALTNKVEFVYPIPGTSTFTYVGTLGAEFFEKTIQVQVDQLDHELHQDWYDLVSENTAAGKAWEFAGEGGDGGLWWFMSPPDNPDQYMSAWWNAGGECCPPPDANGRMVFDLDGAANYTYYADEDAAPQSGTFVLDVANQTLQFGGGLDVLGADPERKSPNGIYQIISLTETELILYVPNNAGGTGWTWIFRPVAG